MKVLLYPADAYGCGYFRMVWPAEYLRDAGHDVTVVKSEDRSVRMGFSADGTLLDMQVPDEYDVIVFQRTTDHRLVQGVKWLREHGRTVVIDVDDDLSSIHPTNPAFTFLDPHRAEHEVQRLIAAKLIDPRRAGMALSSLRTQYTHSWNNLLEACKHASLVTVSTHGLLARYARHGRGHVLPNYLPDHYYGIEHEDSDLVGWPAALHSHPNDPHAVGNSILRSIQDGARFVTVGTSDVARSFGLSSEPEHWDDVELLEWPALIARLGIGIAPLADTLFNSRKSWLKPLELSAAGVPWVASPRTEYVRLNRLVPSGVLAKDPREWYAKLRVLRRDAALRAELSQAGRAVAEQLRLRSHCEEWLEAWQRALDLDRGSGASLPRRDVVAAARPAKR